MTRCCAGRSRRTAVGCSSTPATECARRSRRHVRVRCCGGRTTGTRIAGADGHSDRGSRVARRGLLRHGAEPHGTGDGRRARWPDPGGRVDGRLAQRRRSAGSRTPAAAGSTDRGGRVSSSRSWLRAEFPPLRTVDPSPGNMRPAVTSLIGRESEVADIQTVLHAHRLVTLTGVGGVGKTRLALEVAAQLADKLLGHGRLHC
jgi:hypothetical protein